MTRSLIGFLIFAVLGALPSFARGDLIVVDWKTAGDGLLLLDTATNLEWLNLTVTNTQTFNAVNAQLGAGGTYAGFRYASKSDIDGLFSDAGLTAPFDGTIHQDSATTIALLDQWGAVQNDAGGFGSQFIINEVQSAGTHQVGALYNTTPTSGFGQAWDDNFRTWPDNTGGTTIASALVMDANVPEPGTLSLLGLTAGAAGCAWRRRKKARASTATA